MNVLYLGLPTITSYQENSLYAGLLREFIKNGHNVSAVTSLGYNKGQKTRKILENTNNLILVKTLNLQTSNIIIKGIATIIVPLQYKRAIKKYLKDVQFDLILYPTPPITLLNVVKFIKKRDNAKTYLMLKDIFPQNAVDIGMLSKSGLKGFIYKYFRKKEKNLYKISDKIGCMSPANVEYVLKNNPEIKKEKVEICPNCIEVRDMSVTVEQKNEIRQKYGIPTDKKVFVYGGNLGKPQGIPFVIECLKTQLNKENVYFLIVGNGTEYHKIEEFFGETKPNNMKLIGYLPTDDYDTLLAACDVGLIFLDYRFTIPNYPSRLLTYMQAGLPVLAVTDENSDIGTFLKENEIGEFAPSNDVKEFANKVDIISQDNYVAKKIFDVLQKNYSVDVVFNYIFGK